MANGSIFLLKTGAGVRTPQISDPEPGSELQFTWDLLISDSEVDEGEAAPTITVRRNLNGNPHQDCTIWIEPIVPPSGVSANSNDFTAGFRNQSLGIPQLIPSALAAGIECINGPGTSVSLTWRSDSLNEFTWNRTTIVRDGNEGDRIACYRLFNPSLGTPSDQQVQHTINDTYVAPSGLTLNTIARPYTLCRRTAVVGETVFEVSASVGTISSITLLNDQGGRFAVGTPFAGVWPIITTLVPCDFENVFSGLTPNGSTRGLSNYRPILHIEGSGTVIDQLVRVFAIFPKMNSATIGNLTAADSYWGNGYGFVYSGWGNDAGDNFTFRFAHSANGSIIKQPSLAGVLNNRASHATYVGTWRSLLRNGQSLEKTKGHHCKLKDMNVRAGLHLQPGIRGDQIDCISIGDAVVPADQCTDIWIEYCSFGFAVDECTQVFCNIARGPFVRRIMFMLCIFADPMWSGHQDGPHPYGSLVQGASMEAYFIFCIWMGFIQRSPIFGPINGGLVQNCLIFYFAQNSGSGGMCQTGYSWALPAWQDGPNKELMDMSALWRGNLLHAYASTLNTKARAILCDKVVGLNYLNFSFDQPPYENHFIGFGPEPAHFESDPLSMANVFLGPITDLATSVVAWPPFKLDPNTNPDQYGLLPTETAQQREALFEFVCNNAGVHERVGGLHTNPIIPGPTHQPYVDYYAVNRARSGRWNFYEYQPTVNTTETLAAYWGAEWDGVGGSIGKSMVDVGEAWIAV